MSALDLDALEAEFARRIVDHEYLDMDDIRPLITRLRAAEARTAWQPIETAPLWPDLSPSPTYIMGLRVNRAPVAFVQPAPGVYTDEYGNRVFPIAWAPLPTAPDAP